MDANKHTLELAESILAKPEGWDLEILELAAGFKDLLITGPTKGGMMPHFCKICKTVHTSNSCYHPASAEISLMQEEIERLKGVARFATDLADDLRAERDALKEELAALKAKEE